MGILVKVMWLCLLIIGQSTYGVEISSATLNSLKKIHLEQSESTNKKLLYFWTSWCPDCKGKLRNELPGLKKDHGVEVVTINVDKRESRALSFINDEKLIFPVLRDEQKEIRKLLSVYSVPSWAIIEKKGENWKVIAHQAGSDIDKIKNIWGIVK